MENLPSYTLAGYDYQAIELADYELPETNGPELIECLKRPLVRICNLYKIVNKRGEEVRFRPNWAQRVVLHALYVAKVQRVAIPKARQLGFSTLASIIALDVAYFGRTKQCSIVDQTHADASEKLDKCRFAYERLPPALLEGSKRTTDSSKELAWGNDSSINAGKNARGGTNQFLHISEWGPIAYEDPARSVEIVTGAIPTVPDDGGVIIAESTFKGGKGGDWYEVIKLGLEMPPEHRTRADWLVLFFPWYLDPAYDLEGDVRQIDLETSDYLDKAEARIGRKFTVGQRLWYFKKKQGQKKWMSREYPTFIEEMWRVREPGTIFAEAVDKQRAAGRISDNVLHYEGFPVYSAWDIGAALNTYCWLFQLIGDRIKFLECLRGGPDCATPAAWAKRLKLRNYQYGGHFLPHDGETLWREAFAEAELRFVQVVPKCSFVWDPINDALASFSRCEFAATACEDGLNALEAYRCKQEHDGITIRPVPVHDWASHASKGFECAHAAIRAGMVVDRSAIPERGRSSRDIPILTGVRGETVERRGNTIRRRPTIRR
jgi:hypothetical protein